MTERGKIGVALKEKDGSNHNNGNTEHEMGPFVLENFEIKGRGSRKYFDDEKGDNSLLGFAKHTCAEIKEGENNSLKSKLNGPTHIWKVYSRNKWCKKHIGHNKTDESNVGKLTKSNSNEQKQANSVSGKHDISPPVMRGSRLKEVSGWEE